MKTLNFSGSFVACDLKVGRYRHVELMKGCEYKKVKVISWPWPKVIYKLNVILIFSATT